MRLFGSLFIKLKSSLKRAWTSPLFSEAFTQNLAVILAPLGARIQFDSFKLISNESILRTFNWILAQPLLKLRLARMTASPNHRGYLQNICSASLIITCSIILFLANYSYAIKIEHLKIRPALKSGYSTSFYLDIENDSDRLDYLLSVRIINQPNIGVQIRKTVIEKNIARIIKIDRLIIPAHTKVNLTPLGIYLVATGDLDIIPNNLKLEFNFENAGKVMVEIKK